MLVKTTGRQVLLTGDAHRGGVSLRSLRSKFVVLFVQNVQGYLLTLSRHTQDSHWGGGSHKLFGIETTGHGAISQPTYEQLLVQCPDFAQPSTLCNEWLDKMSDEAGPYYGYNLYDDCGPNDQTKTWRQHQADKLRNLDATTAAGRQQPQLGEQPDGSGRGFGYPCGKQVTRHPLYSYSYQSSCSMTRFLITC
jgi:hypothetical protein